MYPEKLFAVFAPDNASSGGAPSPDATPPAAAQGSPQTSPQTISGGTTPPAGAGGVDGAASTAAPGTAAPPLASATASAPSWLDSLRTSGFDAGKDEKEALANIQRLHQERQQEKQLLDQLRPYAPHVANYLKNAQAFQKWQQEQQQKQPTQAQPQKNVWDDYWQPPEYNPAWMQQVKRDDNGNLVALPGAPPDVAMKVQQYLAYRQEQADKFMANPHEYIAPTVQALAQRIAEETVQKHFQANQQQAATQAFIQQHQQWLFEVDPQSGLPKTHTYFDPNSGQMVTGKVQSVWGKKMADYAKQIGDYQQSRGFHDPEQILQGAYTAVQRDFAISQIEQSRQQQTPGLPGQPPATQTAQPQSAQPQTPPPTPQQAANQKMLDAKNPAGKSAGGRNGNMKPAEEAVTSKNIEKIMMKRLSEAGYR